MQLVLMTISPMDSIADTFLDNALLLLSLTHILSKYVVLAKWILGRAMFAHNLLTNF